MRFSVFTVSIPDFTPEEAVERLSAAGYDGVEWRVTDQSDSADGRPGFWAGNLCTWPARTFEADAPRIRALTEGAGLRMPTVGTYVGCGDLDAVESAMRAAAALGSPALRVSVPGYDGRESYLAVRERALAQYGEVQSLARRHGVRALIELHMGNILPSASAAASFVQRFDPAFVGVIHDAGNMVYEGYENYRLGCEALGPYLAHIHLKNARWVASGKRPDGSTLWTPGWASVREGIVDVEALLRALVQVGYDGWISFEDFSSDVPAAVRIVENLSYVRSVLERVRSCA